MWLRGCVWLCDVLVCLFACVLVCVCVFVCVVVRICLLAGLLK